MPTEASAVLQRRAPFPECRSRKIRAKPRMSDESGASSAAREAQATDSGPAPGKAVRSWRARHQAPLGQALEEVADACISGVLEAAGQRRPIPLLGPAS
jgi:hypothetical protein